MRASFFNSLHLKYYRDWGVFMSSNEAGTGKSTKEHAQWGSRFGYIMVAAGAAIGLGNIWRFPYLAYGGGGGVFIVIYIIMAALMGYPLIKAESAIGRFARANVAASFGAVKKKYRFVGWIAILCTTLIDMYYVIVGGWVLKYAVAYIIGEDFGSDTQVFFDGFTASSVEPLVYTAIVMIVVAVLLFFGITNLVEKVTKIMMPVLFILLVICGIWAVFSTPNAAEGLKYYIIPDFSKMSVKVFADAATQVLFSIGIGWGIFVTLGASLPKENNIKKDSVWIAVCDTVVALTAGFVIIPSAYGAGVDMASGPSLIFVVMTQIFSKLPGGRFIGIFFFIALLFAALSTLFTIIEIPNKWLEESTHMSHRKSTTITSLIIFAGGIIVSLGFGVLSNVQLPFLDVHGVAYYNIYNWLDTFTAYILLPLGCLLTCFYVAKVWGFKDFEKELTVNGRDGKFSQFQKVVYAVIVPALMLVVILNCFGFIN